MSDDPEFQGDKPTAEDVAEADRFDDMCDALEDLARSLQQRFRASGIDYVEVMPQMDVDFRAYVFFLSDAELSACQSEGGLSEIRNFVSSELENLDLGKQGKISVAFEFDSRENVERNFGGSYLMRMT